MQTIKPLVRDTEHNSRQVRPTHSDTSHIDRLGPSVSVIGYEAIIYHINRGRPLDVVVATTIHPPIEWQFIGHVRYGALICKWAVTVTGAR